MGEWVREGGNSLFVFFSGLAVGGLLFVLFALLLGFFVCVDGKKNEFTPCSSMVGMIPAG